MKKTKLEIALEAFKLLLEHLNHNEAEGKIIAFGFASSLFCLSVLSLFYFIVHNSENIIKIIEILK